MTTCRLLPLVLLLPLAAFAADPVPPPAPPSAPAEAAAPDPATPAPEAITGATAITNADLAPRAIRPGVITNADLPKYKPVGRLVPSPLLANLEPAPVATPATPVSDQPVSAEPSTTAAAETSSPADPAATRRADRRIEEADAVSLATIAAASSAAQGAADPFCVCIYGRCTPKDCNPFRQSEVFVSNPRPKPTEQKPADAKPTKAKPGAKKKAK